jgi:hypothetical protein
MLSAWIILCHRRIGFTWTFFLPVLLSLSSSRVHLNNEIKRWDLSGFGPCKWRNRFVSRLTHMCIYLRLATMLYMCFCWAGWLRWYCLRLKLETCWYSSRTLVELIVKRYEVRLRLGQDDKPSNLNNNSFHITCSSWNEEKSWTCSCLCKEGCLSNKPRKNPIILSFQTLQRVIQLMNKN